MLSVEEVWLGAGDARRWATPGLIVQGSELDQGPLPKSASGVCLKPCVCSMVSWENRSASIFQKRGRAENGAKKIKE